LARLHGGRLDLISVLGQGTTATVMLPLEAGESVDAPPERAAASAA
jgi:signal transduction histidine kinase